ncbi:MAG: FliH/SctL family protein, partial [Mariprofundaceae bacterium]
MSSLTPLIFPEDQRPPASHTSSAFPYRSIDAEASNQSNNNTNRMQQLENMLKEVQGRAEIVEKEAYDKAYLAGEKAGMVLGRKRGEQILESLQETLKESESSLNHIQQSFSEAAMDVAKYIAESIVGENINTDPNKLLEIAKQAASQLPDSSGLRIAISPDDYSSFLRLLEDEQTMLSLT